MLKVTDKLLF